MKTKSINERIVPVVAAHKINDRRESNRPPMPPQAKPRQRKPVIGMSMGLKLNP